jgi:hypothetical protein
MVCPSRASMTIFLIVCHFVSSSNANHCKELRGNIFLSTWSPVSSIFMIVGALFLTE